MKSSAVEDFQTIMREMGIIMHKGQGKERGAGMRDQMKKVQGAKT